MMCYAQNSSTFPNVNIIFNGESETNTQILAVDFFFGLFREVLFVSTYTDLQVPPLKKGFGAFSAVKFSCCV